MNEAMDTPAHEAAEAPPVEQAEDKLEAGGPTIPIRTEAGDVDPARLARVQWVIAEIKRAKVHWEDDYKRMREDADFASGLQAYNQIKYDHNVYRLNLVLRHIMLRTAALYAKNPKAKYRRQPKMDFAIWDERPESLAAAAQQVGAFQQAQQAAMMGHNGGPPLDPAMPPPPPVPAEPPLDAMRLLEDYQQGMAERQMAERLGRTLELLWDWFIREPTPRIKVQMKAAVRRAITCGVAYMKMGFQRKLAPRPDQATRMADLTQQLATIERLRADLLGDDPVATEYDRQAEELRQTLLNLRARPEVVLREGPVLDFPRSTAIIPDPRTRSIRGWVGTTWIAEEFELPSQAVEEIYHVRLPGRIPDPLSHQSQSVKTGVNYADSSQQPVRFWQFHDVTTGNVETVAEGWDDYLEEPRAPDVEVEGFFPYYPIVFNEIEHEKRIFPPSDVELLRSPQDEYNRLRESLRQHRIANRPLYVSPNGAFDQKDKTNLSSYEAHDVVTLNGMKEGQNAAELLQPVAKVAIDPAAYEVEGLFSDTMRATGSQEANLGGTSGATATETSVAESSRMSGLASNADDLDETLNDIARDFSHTCLRRMSPEFVKQIVGRGAVWPQLTLEQVLSDGLLEIEAGSSGRPNRERDLANFERAAPYLMQIPGIDPEKMAEYALRLLDDRIDLATFLKPGIPSITAMNSQTQPQAGTGDPASDPGAQGGKGGQNAPATDKSAPGAQPAYGPSGNSVE